MRYSGTSPTKEEEQVLFQRLRDGEVTISEVVEQYLWLVSANVGRAWERFRADLEQEGVLALYRAVEKYDPSRGLRFSTYAVHWVRQAFFAWTYNNMSTVRIPVYMRKAMMRLSRGEDVGHLSESAQDRAHRLNEQSTQSLADVPDPPGERPPDEVNELPQLLVEAIEALPERERRIVQWRFCDGMTLREIGELEGVTVERIRQLIMRALPRMRSKKLRSLL